MNIITYHRLDLIDEVRRISIFTEEHQYAKCVIIGGRPYHRTSSDTMSDVTILVDRIES